MSSGLKVLLAALVMAMPRVAWSEAGAETEEINIVKSRFVSDLLNSAPDTPAVRSLLETLSEDGSWPDIDYKDVSNTGWDHRRHWARLRTLCVAYRRSDSEFHGDPATRSAILSALDFWLQHDFKGRNWYHNFISTPDAITDVLLLVDSEISDAQRKKACEIAAVASLDSRWARPGADRSRIARIAAKLALVRNDPAAFQRAMTVLTRAVHVARAHAVGLQADMSYQHRGDGITSTLTYGIAYVRDSAKMARKVAGTSFEFPVYDWRKIPGTTVVQKKGMPSPGRIYQLGRTDFAGGVSDGLYGATAFDFDSPHDDVKARKAWFFFDKEYVCLGSGIRSGEEHPVATTLNQALLKGDVAVMDGEGVRTIARGAHALRKPRAVWHDQVAYVFPGEAKVHLHNDQVKGSWWRITRQSWARGAGAVELDRFLLWIDHGTAPDHADYAYIVVPGLALDALSDYLAHAGIRILANTTKRQAVMHGESGVVHAVFYEKGEIKVPNGPTFAMKQPGLLTGHVQGGKVHRIAVADPTARRRTLRLALNMPLEGEGENWSATWNAKRRQSEISVTLPQGNRAGQPVVIDF